MEPVRSGTTIDSHESRKRTTKKKASQDGRGAPESQASSNLPGDYQLGDLSSTHYMAPEVAQFESTQPQDRSRECRRSPAPEGIPAAVREELLTLRALLATREDSARLAIQASESRIRLEESEARSKLLIENATLLATMAATSQVHRRR